MLEEHEKRFIEYWEKKRLTERKTLRQLLVGIPLGLLFAIPILIVLFSGRFWYKRADAAANAQLNPIVLIIAVLLIAAFFAIFYKRQQWESKEQYYKELKAREQKQLNVDSEMQR